MWWVLRVGNISVIVITVSINYSLIEILVGINDFCVYKCTIDFGLIFIVVIATICTASDVSLTDITANITIISTT